MLICYRHRMEISEHTSEDLYAEIGRRRNAARLIRRGGPKATCGCGKCPKCSHREWMRQHRTAKALKTKGK